MIKEFTPYSNLWLTATGWFKNIVSWLNDDLETINADHAEKFVEDAIKTLAVSNRFFKERDIIPILKIGEHVKLQVDDFRPKVPLLVALRKKGMKERHWQAISSKVGFTVKPYEGFTFTKVLEMGLLAHLETCMEIGEKASKEFTIETML